MTMCVPSLAGSLPEVSMKGIIDDQVFTETCLLPLPGSPRIKGAVPSWLPDIESSFCPLSLCFWLVGWLVLESLRIQ